MGRKDRWARLEEQARRDLDANRRLLDASPGVLPAGRRSDHRAGKSPSSYVDRKGRR